MGRAHQHEEKPVTPAGVGRRAQSPTARSHALLALQRAAGNEAVSRLLDVQRYAVGADSKADKHAVLAWIAANGPYTPEAAYTEAVFNMSRTFAATQNKKTKVWTVTVAKANVTVSTSVDMPEYSPDKNLDPPQPTDPDAAPQPAPPNPTYTEWPKGTKALRAHEAKHEQTAKEWKTKLLTRLQAFTFKSTAATWDDATAEAGAELDTKWAAWLAEHQTAQNKLDPYVFVL